MKHTSPFAALLLAGPLFFFPSGLHAQNEALTDGGDPLSRSHVNFAINSFVAASFTEDRFDEAAFKVNSVRLELLGRITDKLSYHFRQSYNKKVNPFSLDGLSSSIELANITWHCGERFQLIAGKEFMPLGGYEYYVNAIRVREFSDFNNSVPCYQAGVMGVFALNDSHELVLQIANNRSVSDAEAFLYGRPAGVLPTKAPLIATANWNGLFAGGAVQLRYAASAGSLAQGQPIYYLTAGNVYEKGSVVAYLDLMYSREGVDSKGRLSALQMGAADPVTARNAEYFTAIANVDYAFHPKWNVYLKGVYETIGTYADSPGFARGLYSSTWNLQFCIESFPIKADKGFKVYLHYGYKEHSLTGLARELGAVRPSTHRVSLGIAYIVPVF